MKSIAIKIGGSLMYNDDLTLNENFLVRFKKWYEAHKGGFNKMAIVVGGGKLSRSVGNNAKGIIDPKDVHDVSMQVTQVNAEILQGYLKDDSIFVPQRLAEAVNELTRPDRRVVICGGLKSGWSTDMDAAVFADALKLNSVYKLSNIEGVYTADPREDKSAKLIEHLSWDEYFVQFDINEHSSHKPNVSSPISVEAAIFAKKKGLTFFVSGGKNIYERDDLSLVYESGTVIKP